MTKKEAFLKIIEENPGLTLKEILFKFHGKTPTASQKNAGNSILVELRRRKLCTKTNTRNGKHYIGNKTNTEFVIKKNLTDRQQNLMNYFKMKEINGITETDENVYIDPVPMISSLVRKVVEQKSANYQMQTSNGEIKPVVDIDSFSTFIQSFMEELDDLAADF